MTNDRDRALSALFKQLCLNALGVGTIGAFLAASNASEPAEILTKIFPFFWILILVLAISTIVQIWQYRNTWQHWLVRDKAETSGFILGACILGFTIAGGIFLLPIFSFSYILQKIEPLQMKTLICDVFGWHELGILIGIAAAIAVGLLSWLNRSQTSNCS